jgi:hypothetical protein
MCIFLMGACGSIVVKALCYKQGRSGVPDPMRWISSIYLILPATLGPEVHSAFKINEYQKQEKRKKVSAQQSAADAICDPIIQTLNISQP